MNCLRKIVLQYNFLRFTLPPSLLPRWLRRPPPPGKGTGPTTT